MTEPATPAVRGEPSPATVRCVAAAGVTEIAVWLPVIDVVTVSVAVTEREPAVLRVTLKVPTPAVSVALADRTACVSVLVRWTVPR